MDTRRARRSHPPVLTAAVAEGHSPSLRTTTEPADDSRPGTGLSAVVTGAGAILDVRLAGAGRASRGPHFRWLASQQAPSALLLPVVLGTHDGKRLIVDLADAPDVITINGQPEDCRREAAALVRQLCELDTVVTIVGDVVDAPLSYRCRRAETFPAATAQPGAPATPEVIVSAGLDGLNLAAMCDCR